MSHLSFSGKQRADHRVELDCDKRGKYAVRAEYLFFLLVIDSVSTSVIGGTFSLANDGCFHKNSWSISKKAFWFILLKPVLYFTLS